MSGRLELDHSLLDASDLGEMIPKSFSACLNAHGLYNSVQFVLRLSPRVHQLVDAATDLENPRRDWDALQAYSTYLHETVHWWQHIGSTSGFVVSMLKPTLAHTTWDRLQSLVESGVRVKSLKRWAADQEIAGKASQCAKNANIVVNTAMDMEFFRALIMRPGLAKEVADDPYFESAGHSYQIAYAYVISALSATCDREMQWLPDPRAWEEHFHELAARRVRGYYHRSDMLIAPLGLVELFEGQARFIQLQFLSSVADEPLTLEDLESLGFLSGVYVQAFDLFLRISESARPVNMADPLIALFLLICDVAMNPLRGFPLQIEDYERFLIDADPGIRFARLCRAVAAVPLVRSAIISCGKEEYDDVSAALCSECGYDIPSEGLRQVVNWASVSGQVSGLLRERETFEYELGNLPIRVLFSSFIAFSMDKFERPDFFCWPGRHLVVRGSDPHADQMSRRSMDLWMSHLSLYADKKDDDGIFPRRMPGRAVDAIDRTFNIFYSNAAVYDLTRQWVLQDGPFAFDYSWLSRRHSSDELTSWASSQFEGAFGIRPSAINWEL